MLIVPLQAIPNQVVNVTLGGQSCQISVYQLSTGLYCDMYASNAPVIAGVICQNINRIVRDAYLGFVGDLVFIDMQGDSDPDYSGLGARFLLAYLETSDLTAAA
jgi:hypothetical protein